LDNVVPEFEAEAVPQEAEQIFGEHLPRAVAYASALVEDSDQLGLLGPRELPKLWSRHILNSAVVAELLKAGEAVADVGSGAGLPGIPMAIARPDVHFVLIEPMERRANWLQKQVDLLGLENVDVLRARAEEVGRGDFDVVTARAVSALPKLLRMTVDLIRPGGRLVALKGERAQAEIDESRALSKKLKLKTFEIVFAGESVLSEPTRVVVVRLV
jgi:16S rRNA (guanine527-N7)-methyltransferase